MSRASLAPMLHAEWRKLYGRKIARVGLVFAAVLGFAVPAVYAGGESIVRQLATQQGGTFETQSADVVQGVLYIRNYLILMRVLLVTVTALCFASEFQARTLREDLVRPVARHTLLAAKWLALCAWAALNHAISGGAAALLSVALWGFSGAWGETLLGYAASTAGDCGLAALTLAVAVVTRSVAGTIAGVILYYVLDYATWMALWVTVSAPMIVQVPELVRKAAEQALPFLPSAAFNVWRGIGDTTPWSVQGFVALFIVTALSLVVAERWFHRTDVP